MSDIEATAQDLLAHFSDESEESAKVDKVQKSDPFVELKLHLLGFFKDRMDQITSQQRLKQKVEDSLEVLLESGTLTFDQLMTVYRSLAKQNNEAADSLLSLFKPTPGAPSILAANLAQQEEKKDVYEKLYDEFSSEQIQKMDQLNKLLLTLVESQGVDQGV